MNVAQETKWYEFRMTETPVEARERRLMQMPVLSPVEVEVLKQLQKATWDGDVLSKAARTALHSKGLIVRFNGWQVVTLEGLAVLETLGVLKERR